MDRPWKVSPTGHHITMAFYKPFLHDGLKRWWKFLCCRFVVRLFNIISVTEFSHVSLAPSGKGNYGPHIYIPVSCKFMPLHFSCISIAILTPLFSTCSRSGRLLAAIGTSC